MVMVCILYISSIIHQRTLNFLSLEGLGLARCLAEDILPIISRFNETKNYKHLIERSHIYSILLFDFSTPTVGDTV